MGTLDKGHLNEQRENGVQLGCADLDLEEKPDTTAIENAVKLLLHGLGEDIHREGLRKTPLRVAKALHEGTQGYKQNVKDIVQGALFPESGLENTVGYAGGVGGLVIVRDLDLFSYCESCLMPFQIKCHVGYVPCGKRVVGLSKLSRVANAFAKRLQDPQRLASEISTSLYHDIKPAGVAVLLQCSHIRFPDLESIFHPTHQGWSKVVVSSGSGVFEEKNSNVWSDFLCLTRLRDVNVHKIFTSNGTTQCWCPSRSSLEIPPAKPEMIAAATSIIRSLGENPLRKELIETPSRFANWLMNFENTNLDMKFGKTNPPKLRREIVQSKDEICSELNLSFWSQCEHHLLPFYGVVHIGYFGDGGINPIGRTILQSIVRFFGFKLQVQERLTRQIGEIVSSILGDDVMVVVEASHTCMMARGVEKFGSSTATIAVLGRFSSDPYARNVFLKMLPDSSTSTGF